MRVRPRLAYGLIVVAGLVALTACASSTTKNSPSGGGTTSPPTTPSAGLAGTAWVLSSYQGTNITTVPAAPSATAALAFDNDATVTGSTGCNSFSGRYASSGRSLSITLGPMTQMACASPIIQAQEAAVVQLLTRVDGYQATSDRLILTGPDPEALLIYAAGISGLEGTTWNVTGVNNGDGAVAGTALTDKLRATFGPSGAFTGFGGCNDLSGTYATTGADGVAITGLTSTKKTCAADITSLETQYITALGQVSTFDIAGDMLTLRDSAGASQVILRHA